MKRVLQAAEEWMWNRPLRQKLCMVFIVSMTMVFLVNLMMYSNLNRSESAVESVYDTNRNLREIMDTAQEIQSNVYTYLNTRGTDALEGYYRASAEFTAQMEQMNDRPTDDPLLLKEKNIRMLSETWHEYTERAIRAKRGRDITQYSKAYAQAERVYHSILLQLEHLNSEQFVNSSKNYHEVTRINRWFRMLSIIESIVVLIFNLLVLLYFAERFTKPLAELARHAEQVGRGNLEIEPLVVDRRDEVGIVGEEFNRMVQSLREYISELQTKMEQEIHMKEEKLLMEGHLKDARMGALQARINPHFLYNTMNAGVQLAMMEDAEKTSLFLENVAYFFRYNTKNIGMETWLEDEISQLESYIYIMNTRYADEIDYQACYPDELPRVKIPSMVLQPLAENAIEHGIRGLEGYKLLRVSVREENDYIAVEVQDNGVGIPQEKIQSLMQSAQPNYVLESGERGIGLSNVINRLRLYYGREDAVMIQSEENKGTCIQIRIPKEGKHVSDYVGG